MTQSATEVLAAWAEFKARVWREHLHPRGPDGRFVGKTGGALASDILDKLLSVGHPVFSPERVNRSLDRGGPGLRDVPEAKASDLIADGDDRKAYKKTLKRTAIALDTQKMVEEESSSEGTPPVRELNRQKRAALATLGERLGFSPDETDEATEWLEARLRSWSIGGNLSPRRMEMFAAAAHLRAGGKADDVDTRAMLLQKAYTNAVWDEVHGDKPVTAVRVIGGPYGERLRAAMHAEDDWELEAWPLTSWAEARAQKSLVSRWAGENDVLMERPVSRDETWLMFNGEGTFRSRGLKAPGELVLDDRLPLTSETVEVSDAKPDKRTDNNISQAAHYRAVYKYARERSPEATESERYAALNAAANPFFLELLGVREREPGEEPARLPGLFATDTRTEMTPLATSGLTTDAQRDLQRLMLDPEAEPGLTQTEWAERHGLDYVSYPVGKLIRQGDRRMPVDPQRSSVTYVNGESDALVDADPDREWTSIERHPDLEAVNAERLADYDAALAVIRERGLDQDTIQFGFRLDADGQTPVMRATAVRRGWRPARRTAMGNLEPGDRYYVPTQTASMEPHYVKRPDRRPVWVLDDEYDAERAAADAYDRAMDGRLLVGNDNLVDQAEWEDGFGALGRFAADLNSTRHELDDTEGHVLPWPWNVISPDAETREKTE